MHIFVYVSVGIFVNNNTQAEKKKKRNVSLCVHKSDNKKTKKNKQNQVFFWPACIELRACIRNVQRSNRKRKTRVESYPKENEVIVTRTKKRNGLQRPGKHDCIYVNMCSCLKKTLFNVDRRTSTVFLFHCVQ